MDGIKSVNSENKDVCGRCHVKFSRSRAAKLLPCLHTLCTLCVDSSPTSNAPKESQQNAGMIQGTR